MREKANKRGLGTDIACCQILIHQPRQTMNDIPSLTTAIDALRTEVQTMSIQLSRLTKKIENPEHVKYSVAEACERMKIAHSTYYRRKDAGQLQTFHEGGRVYTTEAAILACERLLRAEPNTKTTSRKGRTKLQAISN